ncbi:hypothetical protein WJX74_001795 [Apatococcus lobatus]|uniref:Uncharacterized protein n=1 Tax=Apatococcus lobatus TaxID=904363 RepID=A0AAW1R0C2_9CHLO
MSGSDSDAEVRAGRLIDEIKALLGEEYVEDEDPSEGAEHGGEQGQGQASEDEEADSQEEGSAGDEEELGYNFDFENFEEYMAEGLSNPSPSGKHEAVRPAERTSIDEWLSAKKFQVQRLREACACRNEGLEELAGISAAGLPASQTPGHQHRQVSTPGLDRKAQAEKALEANLRLRQRLQRTLEELEACANENAAVVTRLEAAVSSSQAIRCRSRLVRDAEDTGGRVGFWNTGLVKPHPHPDAIKLEQALRWLPLQVQHKAWAPQEDARLKHAVLRLARDRKFRMQLGHLEEQVNSGDSSAFMGIQSMRQAVAAMSHDTKEVDEIGRAMDGEDWRNVWLASGLARARSAMDCQLRWLNECRPGLEKGGWSAEATQRLLKLTEEHGLYAWQRISQEMDHKFTPAQCLARFRQGHCFSRQKQQHWPPAEDVRLAEMIKLHGEGQWKAIASGMPGRTPGQCRAHWSTVIKPGTRKGTWSDNEAAMLAKAVEIEGLVWSKVALHVPGRNQLQCRERWYKKANPDRKTSKFTEQEDAALRDLVPKCRKEAGETDWPATAGNLPGRTSQDCKRRWDQLVRLGGGQTSRKRQRRQYLPPTSQTRASHAPSQATRDNAPSAIAAAEPATAGEAQGTALASNAKRKSAGRSWGKGRAARGRGGWRCRRSGHSHSPSSGSDWPSDNDEGPPVPIPLSPNPQETGPASDIALAAQLGSEGGQSIAPGADFDPELERIAYLSAQPQLVDKQVKPTTTAEVRAAPAVPSSSLLPASGARGQRPRLRSKVKS